MSLQQKHFFWFWRNLIFWPSFTISHNIHQLFWPDLYILTRFLEHCSLIWSGVWTAAWKGISAQVSRSSKIQRRIGGVCWEAVANRTLHQTGLEPIQHQCTVQQPIMEMRCDVLVFILFCQKNGRKKTFDQHLFKTSGDQRKALHRLWAASQFLEVFAVLRSSLLESRNRYQGASLRIKFIQKYFISFPSPSFSPP